ncbi:hypothetical protein C8R44DRAFT_745217 [Mycena epipterygia]|nr:hypothetical protein C8R44DRAFT_745217 [Mycena epipterygia]
MFRNSTSDFTANALVPVMAPRWNGVSWRESSRYRRAITRIGAEYESWLAGYGEYHKNREGCGVDGRFLKEEVLKRQLCECPDELERELECPCVVVVRGGADLWLVERAVGGDADAEPALGERVDEYPAKGEERHEKRGRGVKQGRGIATNDDEKERTSVTGGVGSGKERGSREGESASASSRERERREAKQYEGGDNDDEEKQKGGSDSLAPTNLPPERNKAPTSNRGQTNSRLNRPRPNARAAYTLHPPAAITLYANGGRGKRQNFDSGSHATGRTKKELKKGYCEHLSKRFGKKGEKGELP